MSGEARTAVSDFTVEKAEPLQPIRMGNRRDMNRYGKRPAIILKHLIVTVLVKEHHMTRPFCPS